jgi:dihydroorotate dehydrogenase
VSAPRGLYGFLFRNFLTRLDPERAHALGAIVIRCAGLPGVRRVLHHWTLGDGRPTQALGLTFESPFGMAAGFDKDARYVLGLYALGFGHVEVGTLTAHAQPGNARPRLFRLVADRALINRMGFNNGGAAAAVERLRALRSRAHRPVIGVNIGKSRIVEVDDAVEDYLESTRLLAPLADYLVVNVSSPNTPGLRGLQEIDKLEPLLVAVQAAAGSTPLLVKIAPDLSENEVERVANLAVRLQLSGIIATNTTLSREGLSTPDVVVQAAGAGGLSGAPLASRAREVLVQLRSIVPTEMVIISVGGVESADDVSDRLSAGANLVQGYSAFVYEGPLWARRVNRGLRWPTGGTADA